VKVVGSVKDAVHARRFAKLNVNAAMLQTGSVRALAPVSCPRSPSQKSEHKKPCESQGFLWEEEKKGGVWLSIRGDLETVQGTDHRVIPLVLFKFPANLRIVQSQMALAAGNFVTIVV